MLRKLIFLMVAFSILNQSIDIDYCSTPADTVSNKTFDDIDSVTELVIEEIMDNPNYTHEDGNDDSGNTKNTDIQKSNTTIYSVTEYANPTIHPPTPVTISYAIGDAEALASGFKRSLLLPPDSTHLIG